jgi:hypothetical protein
MWIQILASIGTALCVFLFTSTEAAAHVSLHRDLFIHEDQAAQASLGDILKLPESSWQANPVKDAALNKQYSSSAFWLRFQLHDKIRSSLQDLALISAYPLADRMDFHIQQKDGSFVTATIGDRVQDSGTRIIPARLPAILLRPDQDEGVVYIRVSTQGTYLFNFRLDTVEAFRASATRELFIFGSFVGVVAAMILYNLFVFITFNNPAYLVYIVSISGLSTFSIGFSGMLNFLFPESFYISNSGHVLAAGIAHVATDVFCIMFLDIRRRSPFWIIFSLIISSSIVASFLLHFNYRLGASMISILGIINPIVLLIAGISACIQRYRPAYFYTFSWVVLLMGTVATPLELYNIVQPNFISEWGMFIGISLEAVLISMALGDKIKHYQSQARKEISKQNEVISSLNRNLAHQVKEQTRDITSILEHINQGLLVLYPEGKRILIHKAYSKALEQHLEQSELANQDIFILIFDRSNLNPEQISMLRSALDLSLGGPDIQYAMNSHLLPVEIEVAVTSGRKIFELDWSPILAEGDVIQKILLTMRDVTNLRELLQESQRKDIEIARIVEITSVERQHLVSFFKISEYYLRDIHHLPWADRDISLDQLRMAFRNLHTMKGLARSYKLKLLSDQIHRTESILQNVMRGTNDLAQFQSSIEALQLDLKSYIELATTRLGLRFHDGIVDISLAQLKRWYQMNRQFLSKSRQSHEPALEFLAEIRRCYSLSLGDVLQDTIQAARKLALECHKPVPIFDIQDHKIMLRQENAYILKAALMHLINNSIDHGIESETERWARKKPAHGTIYIHLFQESGLYHIHYFDDGQGLDLRKIEARAIQKGLCPHEHGLRPDELSQFIFVPEFSTKDHISQISGRGIGLDAVKTCLAEKGARIELRLRSTPTIALGTEALAAQASIQDNFHAFELLMTLPPTFIDTWE